MTRETRFTSYDSYGERIIEAVDLDQSGRQYRPYRAAPSMAAQGDPLPDDPIPLFLSDPAEQRSPPGAGKARAVIAPRTLKAGILATTAAAIVFVILSVQDPLALFANASASLIGISAGQPGADRPVPAIQSAAGAEALSPATRAAPSRDEIAAAFKNAHQGQAEIRQPPAVAAAPPPPPPRRLDADELAALLKRARSLIAIGDIAPARLLLERAADAQEASAALLLAQTYDPAVLGTPDMRSITPDPATARGWYQKAARFGSLEAQQRLAQMQN
jgi:TPR repeat protein